MSCIAAASDSCECLHQQIDGPDLGRAVLARGQACQIFMLQALATTEVSLSCVVSACWCESQLLTLSATAAEYTVVSCTASLYMSLLVLASKSTMLWLQSIITKVQWLLDELAGHLADSITEHAVARAALVRHPHMMPSAQVLLALYLVL